MGYLELKPAASLASKSLSGNVMAVQNGSHSDLGSGKTVTAVTQHLESGSSVKDPTSRTKPTDGRLEKTESVTLGKSDPGHQKLKGSSMANGSDIHSSMSAPAQGGTSRSVENQKQVDESVNRTLDENMAKVATKNSADSEV